MYNLYLKLKHVFFCVFEVYRTRYSSSVIQSGPTHAQGLPGPSHNLGAVPALTMAENGADVRSRIRGRHHLQEYPCASLSSMCVFHRAKLAAHIVDTLGADTVAILGADMVDALGADMVDALGADIVDTIGAVILGTLGAATDCKIHCVCIPIYTGELRGRPYVITVAANIIRMNHRRQPLFQGYYQTVARSHTDSMPSSNLGAMHFPRGRLRGRKS